MPALHTLAPLPNNVLRYSSILRTPTHLLSGSTTPKLSRATSMPPVPPRNQYSTSAPPKIQKDTSFTYRLAAASAPKSASPRQAKPNQDFFLYTSTDPHPSPPYLRSTKRESGEDAFFATTIGGSSHHVAFGIADGVGGWQDQGVDPSEFSHGLCGLMAGTAHLHELGLDEEGRNGNGNGKGKALRPQALMQTAYEAVIGNPRIMAGGCTASLAVVEEDGVMEAANLGDSGFLILSPGKVSHRSPIQTHAFNTPYQLSKVPPRLQSQYAIFGGGSAHFSEQPSQADISRHALKHGDIVLFATDGVWDNLSAQDTLATVTKIMEEKGFWFRSHNLPGAETMLNEELVRALPKRIEKANEASYLPGVLATAVMREAKIAGLDRRRDGPFAKEVKMRYPQEGWQGGKPDDIAVVVCVAVEDAAGEEEGNGKDEEDEKPIKAKL